MQCVYGTNVKKSGVSAFEIAQHNHAKYLKA